MIAVKYERGDWHSCFIYGQIKKIGGKSMKIMRIKFLAVFVATMLVLTLVSATALTAPAPADYGTQRDYALSLIRNAGLKENVIGTSAADRDALIRSLGFLDNWNYSPTAMVTDDNKASIDAAMSKAYNGLRTALNKYPMEPYFVNGFAQPIFYYGNSSYYDTSGEGVVRFLVYVETNYDTDHDGKLDMIKVMVQLPRAALTQGMKCATIYHAQPYNEGTNGSGVSFPSALQAPGNAWLAANGPFTHDKLYRTPPPRVPAGEMTTAEAAAKADWRDWRYNYTYNSTALNATVVWGVSNGNQISSLNMNDYFVVRGFALVSSAGLATVGGEGLSSMGTDIEIDAYKCVIDWLNGTAKAYTDKTSNIEVKADWSNGLVGMTGTSYGGTTNIGLATSGIKGLETIIPVAAISSWYEYQNQQGIVNSGSGYTAGLAWYILSRIGAPDWYVGSPTRDTQIGYLQQLNLEAAALNGNYGEHWARRDYTLQDWYKDWGPNKMRTPIMIVHGGNDNNVRPKQSVLLYQAAQKAGLDTRVIWDQGHHMTPNNHQIGIYTYQEWQNLWYSHYLYKVDNNVLERMPNYMGQDNLTGDYISYDSWECDKNLIFSNDNRVTSTSYADYAQQTYEEPVEYTEDYFILGGFPPDDGETDGAVTSADLDITELAEVGAAADDSDESANAMPLLITPAAAEASYTLINSANGTSSWQNLLNVPTAASTLYTFVLPEDITVKGVVEIHFRAALATLGSALNTTTSQVRVHGKLVEIARPGTTLRYYGGNAVGDTISTSNVVTGGVYRGGGLSSSNLVRFTATTTGTYRELCRGWMSLAHPFSAYDSQTANLENRINLGQNIGVFHDYTLYLQPTFHTARKGNRLAIVLTTGGPTTAAYTGTSAYTFNIDNEASYVVIPVEMPKPDPVTIAVESAHIVPGEKVDITYSIKDNSHGFTTLDVDLPFNSSVYTPLTVTPSALLSGGAFDYSIGGNVLNVTFSSADYAAGDGALFTVTYQVDNDAYARSVPLDVKVNALNYGDFLDKLQDLDVTVNPGVLSTYSYRVYLVPSQTDAVAGGKIAVDVMLIGGVNYSQIATEITYDANLLKFDGHTNLVGWAAAVTEVAPNKVAVRSVPGMNMITGASCFPDIRIVKLEFTVKDGLTADSIVTDLGFDTATVAPAGGVTGTTVVPSKSVSITLHKPAEQTEGPDPVEEIL
jgi:X-Pro dipeptidyl-peptidase